MRRTVVLMVFLGIVFPATMHAQFKVSSNDKLSLVSNPENELTKSANTTIQNFFDLAQNGQRTEWENLLSKNCYKDGIPREYVNQWFDHLANHKMNYNIVEISSPKTNQKIIYYTSSDERNKKKTMVLVKEKGQWKIYQAGL